MKTKSSTTFLIRVELAGDAPRVAYETVNAAMQGIGFTRTIQSSEREIYGLPTGEYHGLATLNRDQIAKLVIEKLNALNLDYSVLVAESVGITWGGLTKQ